MHQQATIDDLTTEIEQMRTRLAQLEAMVAGGRGAGAGTATATDGVPDDALPLEVPSSRRNLLRNVAIVTGGAVVAAVATSAVPAAAVAMNTGVVTTEAAGLTTFNYTGAPVGTAWLFQAGSSYIAGGSAFPSALGGWSSTAAVPTGIYGFSPYTTGHGVIGVNANVVGGTGVSGRGVTGVSGLATNPSGIGVYGSSSAGTGVSGVSTDGPGVDATSTNGNAIVATSTVGAGLSATTTNGNAVVANSTAGTGVLATGATGVIGIGLAATAAGVAGTSALGVGVHGTGTIGVFGLGVDATSPGVFGASTDGTGVTGSSNNGPGVHGLGVTAFTADGSDYGYTMASASRAAMLLSSDGYSTDPDRIAPPARSDAHFRGELDVDVDGGLWWCIESGAPGVWRQLAGPSTAGAFHAITPGRVYDSRVATPGPIAPLAAGTSRTVSVADRRTVSSGAIDLGGFVPVGATAIAANITVVETVGAGFLTANPGGVTTISAATINWSESGQILNNGVTLTLDGQRRLNVIAGGGAGAATHFVVDVSGYYL